MYIFNYLDVFSYSKHISVYGFFFLIDYNRYILSYNFNNHCNLYCEKEILFIQLRFFSFIIIFIFSFSFFSKSRFFLNSFNSVVENVFFLYSNFFLSFVCFFIFFFVIIFKKIKLKNYFFGSNLFSLSLDGLVSLCLNNYCLDYYDNLRILSLISFNNTTFNVIYLIRLGYYYSLNTNNNNSFLDFFDLYFRSSFFLRDEYRVFGNNFYNCDYGLLYYDLNSGRKCWFFGKHRRLLFSLMRLSSSSFVFYNNNNLINYVDNIRIKRSFSKDDLFFVDKNSHEFVISSSGFYPLNLVKLKQIAEDSFNNNSLLSYSNNNLLNLFNDSNSFNFDKFYFYDYYFFGCFCGFCCL